MPILIWFAQLRKEEKSCQVWRSLNWVRTRLLTLCSMMKMHRRKNGCFWWTCHVSAYERVSFNNFIPLINSQDLQKSRNVAITFLFNSKCQLDFCFCSFWGQFTKILQIYKIFTSKLPHNSKWEFRNILNRKQFFTSKSWTHICKLFYQSDPWRSQWPFRQRSNKHASYMWASM